MKRIMISIYNRIINISRKRQIIFAVMVFMLTGFWLCLPSTLFKSPTSYVLEASDGTLLGATIATDGQWRFPYNPNTPEKFRDCIINFEDKRFNYHPGVDPIAMIRALQQNFKASSTVSGGSTISMQVIRLSRNKSRTVWQKLVESIQALRLELRYSKKEILALYASHAPFGSNVVGLDAAAWRYYGRSAQQLSWGEMAALAVLPNAPALVHPGKNRNTLLQKRNFLLEQLLKREIIDSSTYSLAKLEPLPEVPQPLPQLAPHLLQRFKKENPKDSVSLLRSTISKSLQQTVIQLTEQHHRALKGNGIQNICALVLDVLSGSTLAYVGNAYHPEQADLQSHVDVIASPRSPGSTLKPLLYASMLNDGQLLPHSLIPDIPTQIGSYMPQNFDRDYDGMVPASKALARSLNVPAVRMLRDYKYPRFYSNLVDLGFTTLNRPADHYGLSLILGGCEVTPWDLAGVYASMARTLLRSKSNSSYHNAADFFPATYRARAEVRSQNNRHLNFVDPLSIWYMFQAMEEVMRPGEEGLWKQFNSSQRVAWKTGTSFGFRDAWAVGVTPRHVVLVWAGNATGEGRPGLTGVQTAAPVMFDIIKALPASEWFTQPVQNSTWVSTCRQTGLRAGAHCPTLDSIAVTEAGIQAPQCKYHNIIHLDPSQRYRVSENCISPSAMVLRSWLILPPVMEWYYRRKHFDYQPPPPYMPGCGDTEGSKTLDIIYPENNARIYIPREFSGERGHAVFIAAHQKPEARLFWHLDNEFAGSTTRYHQLPVNPPPGKHLLTVVDEQGVSVTRNFEVLDAEKE